MDFSAQINLRHCSNELLYITRKECGDTVANYGCNKAAVDNTRIKNINCRTFRLPMGSLLQRFSTIYNEFQNYSSENELLNHAFILYFHISKTITDSNENPLQMALTTSTSQ